MNLGRNIPKYIVNFLLVPYFLDVRKSETVASESF